VLEVGPGFGRVTKILTQLWPSEDNANQPPTKFAIADLSEAAIEQTSAACPQIDFAYEVLPLPDGLASRRPFPSRTFDLVVAVEVLLHIPPSSVQQAVNHLLSCLKPARQPTRAHGVSPAATTLAKGQGSGVLITCDWTQPLPSSTPIRNQNFCHDYQDLFAHSKLPATIVAAVPTGLQTIFVVTRGG
jgi:SAM-dependent methyltransferase